jgi:three-Cys-motif partner protein
MGSKDLHSKPFDEGTIAKLEIFEAYAQAWIPTFVMPGISPLCIFDFFAGTGYDQSAIPGSPIRILQKIEEQRGHLFQKKIEIRLFLNEYEPQKKDQQKFALLREACDDFLDQHKLRGAVKIIYSNKDFQQAFDDYLPEIKKYPSLIYLDQNGIKFLSNRYLFALEETSVTDFLYFVSSSYIRRFGNTEEFKNHIEIDMEAVLKAPPNLIHRVILDQLRAKLPSNSKLKLYPYSIKKGANIYGIIFGAKHPRAVDKFLNIAWKGNKINGEANFDIDDDRAKEQLSLFEGKRLTKREKFEYDVRDLVLSGKLSTNVELYYFALEAAHTGAHAAECIKKMKKAKEIDYEGPSPKINYENVVKKNVVVNFRRMKK